MTDENDAGRAGAGQRDEARTASASPDDEPFSARAEQENCERVLGDRRHGMAF
ncbi:hypothetical protein [Plantactinospora sp. KLBMP9567]|uniref:hypothetical protein n=1 Tax=Plantactinospora sp. KLBMP9567 TaxID=3085900 RepID=UPI002981744E|nr:hypothetical protein [Plantactinospora sp. KLBMP9567]MDW5324222.1 hypothetical protein [Plantactinospora sp. KLBMP9567]